MEERIMNVCLDTDKVSLWYEAFKYPFSSKQDKG
jgi:hypothetical protein